MLPASDANRPILTPSGVVWEPEPVWDEGSRHGLAATLMVLAVAAMLLAFWIGGPWVDLLEARLLLVAWLALIPSTPWLLPPSRLRLEADASGLAIRCSWPQRPRRWTWDRVERVEAGDQALLLHLRTGEIRRIDAAGADPEDLREVAEWIAGRSGMRMPSAPEVPDEIVLARSRARDAR